MKRGHESIFRFVSTFFLCDFNVIIFFIMKGVMVIFGGMSKNFLNLRVSFFMNLKVASKTLRQICLIHTTVLVAAT